MIRLTWKLGEKSGALYVPENVIVMEHEVLIVPMRN